MAPADGPLDEEAFRKTPLDFVGDSALRWDGDRTTDLRFKGWRTSVGTVPEGSMWAKNPIPGGSWEWQYHGPTFGE